MKFFIGVKECDIKKSNSNSWSKVLEETGQARNLR